MSAGSRPWSDEEDTVQLETEPFVFFHPTQAGTAVPGGVQPVDTAPLLEEEPSTWPQCDEP